MKTASSSIELNYATEFMGPEDVLSHMEEDEKLEQNNKGWFNPIPEIIDGSYSKYKTAFQFYHRFKYGPHQSARVIQHRVSKQVWNSYFKFTVERNPYDKMVSMFYMNWGKSGIDRPGKAFDDWVRRNENIPYNFPLYTWKNRPLVDKIIRYEELNDQLKEIYNQLGVPFKELKERAKSDYRSNSNYKDLHSSFTRKKTKEIFEKELSLLNYEF